MLEILLPRTDTGALVQVAVVVVATLAGVVALRRHPDLRLLVLGLGMAGLGWMALRTLH